MANQHYFIISPPGNGVDCIRTWEALYCGLYPVVQKSAGMDFFAKHLPILVIQDLRLLKKEDLDLFLSSDKPNELDFLKASFWKDLILKDKERFCG
jgi:hypothetical protein